MNTLYEQLLLFPDRAENLGQFSSYDVDLGHWRQLSAAFGSTFRAVYERGASAILLVQGGQGSGKTLFSRRLVEDFEHARKGVANPDPKNLWHTLVGEDPARQETIEKATLNSSLHRVSGQSGWLDRLRETARSDQHRVRIFVIDDAHKDVFMREWASLTQAEYLGFKERGTEAVALGSVAERLVEDCRADFVRSIFLLLSNDAKRMEALKVQIDRSHKGLATVLELPLPDAKTKEQIIRKNTNRLNQMSYWVCLDAAGKDERRKVYDILMDGGGGFTESFQAVSTALASGTKRAGRPANRNIITLVTLGSPPDVVRSFIDDQELPLEEHHRGAHIGSWWAPERWASRLYQGNEATKGRRARLVESEFALGWVALDMRATFHLCQPSSDGDLGSRLLNLIRFTPSIGKRKEVEQRRVLAQALDEELEKDEASSEDLADFENQFVALGQRRSSIYEPAILRRMPGFSRGLEAFPAVKPDIIEGEYRPCSLTEAKDGTGITEAIRRTGHVIEFTAHLQADMNGLEDYLIDKVERYALLLESV